MGPGFESPKVHQNKDIEYPFNVFVYRGIAQLVESRSPKPLVVGSSPTAPAKILVRKNGDFFFPFIILKPLICGHFRRFRFVYMCAKLGNIRSKQFF